MAGGTTTTTIDPERLLEHGDWLRALAARLAGGDDAEDLVQEAYLAALRRPPRDRERPLRPWLAQVVRNLAALRRRGRGREAVRERDVAAVREAPPSADTLLERAIALRVLAELVVELDEPLRTTLLLRYDEGLTAERIATLQGVPAGTVRWRLKTALDRLRAGMDERERGGSGGGTDGRGRWRSVLAAPGLTAARAGSSVAVAGAWMMKKWIAAAALLVIVAVVGWWGWRRAAEDGAAAQVQAEAKAADAAGAPGTAATAAAAGAGGTAAAAAGAAAAAQDGGPPASGRAAVAVDDPAPLGVFEGRVINWSTGDGVSGVELSFAALGASATASVQSGEGGRFELVPTSAVPHVLVSASKPGFLPYAPEWGQSPVRLVGRRGERVKDIVFFLFPAVDYTGTVVAPDGKPVAGAKVRLVGTPQGEQALETLTDSFVTDARGKFVFHAPDDAVFEARHPDFGPGRARLDGPVSVSRQMVIRLAAKGEGKELGRERLAGRVIDAGGQAVAGAQVRVVKLKPGPADLPPLFDTSDDDGRFRIDGLDSGELDVVVTHETYAPATARVAAGKSDVVVTLEGGSALTGRVVDAAGAPVPSFTVLVLAAGGLRRTEIAARSVVDADGRFEIAHLVPGEYRVIAAARGYAASAEATASAPGEVTVTLPRGASVFGKVTTAGGAGVSYARVMVETTGGSATIAPANAGTVTDEDGRYRLTGVPPGTVTLSVGAADHHMRLIGGIQITDGAEVGPVDVDLRPTQPGETPQLELVGIGVKLEPSESFLVVAEVIPGGGAAAAGILTGDQILAVDGIPVATLGLEGAIGKIRGVEGTRVVLRVRRGAAGAGGAGTAGGSGTAAGAVVDVVVERRRLRT